MIALNKELKDMGYKDAILKQLQVSYLEACKSSHFRDLVEELPLKREELMKYTSSLENCALEYGHCKNCANLMECTNQITGYAYLPSVREGKLYFEYQACRYQKKQQEEVRYQKYMEIIELPRELKEASMSKIDVTDKRRMEVIQWLDTFVQSYPKDKQQKGLYLYGSFGCGKTYLIAACFQELAKQKVRSAMLFWPEFLRNLKGSFQTDFKEQMERVKKVPLLLIDDIGAENTTAWGRDEILCPLLQYRMQQHLPTFFTSNLEEKELETHLSISKDSVEVVKARRVMERIHQLTDQKQMISANRRK